MASKGRAHFIRVLKLVARTSDSEVRGSSLALAPKLARRLLSLRFAQLHEKCCGPQNPGSATGANSVHPCSIPFTAVNILTWQ